MSSFIEQRYFLFRRLHSLSGIVPVGAFFLVHMFLNSRAAQSPEQYQWVPDTLDQVPYVWAVEIFGILLPILFHAVLGVVIARQGGVVQGREIRGKYESLAYKLQRVTGIALFVLILLHLWQTWWVHQSIKIGNALHPEQGLREFDIYGLMHGYTQNFLWLAVYALFVLIAAYHFGNGIFNFACKWGFASSKGSQRFALVLGLAIGGLGLWLGYSSLWGLTFSPWAK